MCAQMRLANTGITLEIMAYLLQGCNLVVGLSDSYRVNPGLVFTDSNLPSQPQVCQCKQLTAVLDLGIL